MLEEQRKTLKENAEALANLLTENVPYLLGHYMQNGVLNEDERESIISADSASAIRMKLIETLADKDGLTLDAVLDGLSATENHCVVAEINSLLSGRGEDAFRTNDDGSGDKLEDVSAYANDLVDQVIAKAEETTSQMMLDKDENPEEVVPAPDMHEEKTSSQTVEQSENEEEDGEMIKVEEKLVETFVEVHTSETEEKEEEVEKEPEKLDVELPQEMEVGRKVSTDRNVSFSINVATVIEDGKRNDKEDEEDNEAPASPSLPSPTTEGYQSHGLDAHGSENEDDVDNIDIEKEFVMPTEQAPANNTSNKVANGGPTLTRMESNDIILEDNDKKVEKNNNEKNDDDLDAILARKALVRQQVEKFEKSSPAGPGKIKYSFRSATPDKAEVKDEEKGSNVKNLKNFFQRLSMSESTTPASGPVKPVGKLKVTFPAS